MPAAGDGASSGGKLRVRRKEDAVARVNALHQKAIHMTAMLQAEQAALAAVQPFEDLDAWIQISLGVNMATALDRPRKIQHGAAFRDFQTMIGNSLGDLEYAPALAVEGSPPGASFGMPQACLSVIAGAALVREACEVIVPVEPPVTSP